MRVGLAVLGGAGECVRPYKCVRPYIRQSAGGPGRMGANVRE